MKLFKKISLSRAKELTQFKAISQKLKLTVNAELDSPFKKVSSVDDLSFYIVIDYINVVEKIDYSKIFPDDNPIVDFDKLMKEHRKVVKFISNKKNSEVEVFKKLGLLNEVQGCYILATHKRRLKNIDLKDNVNSIIVKLDNKNLPKEIADLCEDYSLKSGKLLIREQREFEQFLKLSSEEQELVINDFMKSISFPPIYDDIPITRDDDLTYDELAHSTIKIEDIAGNKVNFINSIPFLEGMLKSALETENFELCAKIRDRILELNMKNEK
jgi:hypothetical protein